MDDARALILCLAAGAGIGGIYFGGLWWTLRRAAKSRRPVLGYAGGLLLRAAIALGGFYLVGAGDAKRLLACLGGFVIARTVLVRIPPKEARRAP